MRRGRRARHPLLQGVAIETDSETCRIGFSVGKHVGGAVIRNRVKRRLRMIVRELDWRPGFDLVIVTRPEARTATYRELQDAVRQNAHKLALLHTEDR